jgi:hypothetical protein
MLFRTNETSDTIDEIREDHNGGGIGVAC